MTHTETKQMHRTIRNQLRVGFDQEFWRLWTCGGIDANTATASEVKAVAVVALENIAKGLTPLHPDGKKCAANLRHF